MVDDDDDDDNDGNNFVSLDDVNYFFFRIKS